MLVSPEQPQKAWSSIAVTELPMVMLVSPVQQEKALRPMVMTELGMIMLVSPLQSEKARSPIAVTELGIIVFWQPINKVLLVVWIMALQLLRESYFGLPLSTVMLVNPVQPQNA